MAKKLTADEQGMVVALAKVLSKISYGPVRSNASGIASGLVRLRKDPLLVADVDGVLERYGCAGSTARGTLERAGVLVPVYGDESAEGEGREGAGCVGAGSDAGRTVSSRSAGRHPDDGAGAAVAHAVGRRPGDGGKKAEAAPYAYHLALPQPAGKAATAEASAEGAPAEPAAEATPGRAAGKRGSGKATGKKAAAEADASAKKDAASSKTPAPAKVAGTRAARSGARPAAQMATQLLGPGPRTLAEVPHETLHTPEATDLRRKILDLDPRLWLNGWLLGWPEAYALFEGQLRSLDQALAGKTELGDGTLTCRELSYQVFGDEKFLEQDGDGRKLLDRMGLRDIVRARPQPRLSLLHHVPRKRPHMRIVVTENLDPWLDIRELMYADGRRLILGERVEGVIFGNGYLIDDSRRLPEFLESLGCEDVEILYWGDIDRAGLQIYDRLRRVAEGNFVLRPFAAAYAAMARRAATRFPDPLDNEASAQEGVPFDGLDDFCAELPEDVRSYVHDVIAGKRLIPQEILTRYDL